MQISLKLNDFLYFVKFVVTFEIFDISGMPIKDGNNNEEDSKQNNETDDASSEEDDSRQRQFTSHHVMESKHNSVLYLTKTSGTRIKDDSLDQGLIRPSPHLIENRE